ncbi:hypothetical protein JCM10207_002356 [Rhodosporidiobolus poonsookiae]
MADKYEELPERPNQSTSRPHPAQDVPMDDEPALPSDDDDDEDDPVVRRLPVYYSPQFLHSLALLQYPDRPPHPDSAHPLLPPSLQPDWANDPAQSAGKLSTKYKPKTQHLEITVPMEKHPDRWNEDTAKVLAQGVVEDRDRERERAQEGKRGRRKRKDAADDEDEQRYKEDKEARRLDKMVLASTGVPEVTSYLVGVVKNDALHLNPVNQTFQLRPSLTYLDNLLAIERRAKRAAQAGEDDTDDDVSDTELKKEEAKAVQVSVKSGDAVGKGPLGGGNGRAGASLFAPLRAEEMESWKPLEHHHARTDAASKAFNRLFAPTKQKLTSTTKPKEYLVG